MTIARSLSLKVGAAVLAGTTLFAVSGAGTTATSNQRISALESQVAQLNARVTALEGVHSTPAPTATPRPSATSASATASPRPTPTAAPSSSTSAIPPIPSGTVILNGATGTLGKFVVNTYPDDHIGQPGQLMTVSTRYSNGARQITFHDGYLDARATKRADGLYDGVLLATGTPAASGFTPTFDFQYGRVEYAFQTGGGKGAWNTFWGLISTSWSSPEIDWIEVIGGRLTANVHGSSSDGQKASEPMDAAWHVGAIDKRATGTSFYLDGRLVGTGPAMSARMILLADAKVGLAAPDATTGEPFLHLAWVVLR